MATAGQQKQQQQESRGASAAIFEEAEEYVPISERPEWAGVVPRPLPAQAVPVVEIARDQQFGDLMDYFWASVEAQEVSERVLELTEEIIVELNSANYTVWEWRWRCLEALGGMAERAAEEDALARRVAHDNPKNYQLWNHRRRCALALGLGHAEKELAFAAEALAFDAKNYHAWAHRQAVVAAFGRPGAGGAVGAALWGAELAFTERLLRDDVRNNSAWNQRHFVLANGPAAQLGEPAEVYDREVDFVATKLRLAPHNESAWNYLRGLAALPGTPSRAAATDARWRAACEEALAAEPSCAPALALLADVYAEQAGMLGAAGGSSSEGEAGRAAVVARRLAGQVFGKLVVADPIRAPYYQHRAAQLARA